MAKPVDLLIIGGGVLGTFHAFHGLSRGLNVVLLERSARPRGATVRNFGQVVPSGMDQKWQLLGRDSLQVYKDIQAQTDITIRQQGSIYIASDEEEQTLLEELHEINRAADYESELWSAAQCLARYPQLNPGYCRAGLFFPQEVSVNPREMINRLQRFLGNHQNFQSHFSTCVHRLRVGGKDGIDWVEAETTDGRRFVANKAIVCSGSEFQLLFPEHFLASDLVAVKLQMLRLRSQPQSKIPGNVLTGLSIRRYESFSQCPSWESIKSREPEDSMAKKWGVHILFKQEVDGSIVLGDSHEYATVQNIAELDFELRSEINNFILDEAGKIFDLPSWDVESAWAGVYCQTNDPTGIHTQTIDEHIHIVTGIGGKGMTSSAGFVKQYMRGIYND